MSTSITEVDVLTALRNYLIVLFPAVEVVQTQDNGVPMPKGGFIAMNNVNKVRLSQNVDSYLDPLTPIGEKRILTPTNFTIQLDFYGDASCDWATEVMATFFDGYGFEAFPENIKPLYTNDPIQVPLINGEQQWEQRWKLDVSLQYNPVVSTPMQFFDKQQAIDMIAVQ